jgi:hypothetical protein
MNESKYDIFIPVKMYPGIGFRGVSDREFSANNEKAFDLLNWRASFHDAQSGDRYIIVRTNCSEHEARNAIDEIIARLPLFQRRLTQVCEQSPAKSLLAATTSISAKFVSSMPG